MAICRNCGGEIVFRYIDGQRTPIHTSGGWCEGVWEQRKTFGNFKDTKSYLNPNANCPVCGAEVFFYENSSGSRVFFDALGWPWPKHPCTDKKASQSGHFERLRLVGGKVSFKNKHGEPLVLYELSRNKDVNDRMEFYFRQISGKSGFWGSISKETLKKRDIKISDIFDAPSFVMKRRNDGDKYRLVEFISGRKQKVISIKMRIERK